MSNSELATSYAALILADEDVEITVRRYISSCRGTEANQIQQADKLQTILKAANVEDVEPIWTTLYAKVCHSPAGSTPGILHNQNCD